MFVGVSPQNPNPFGLTCRGPRPRGSPTVKNKLVNPLVAAMESLDNLDFQILRELIVGSGAYLRSDRVSLEAVARAVGVHPSTVADRPPRWGRMGVFSAHALATPPRARG